MDTQSTSDRRKLRRRKRPPKLEIGWCEWAALPDLGVERINAKIDTGAKSSAIHAFRIKETTRDGAPHVEFFLHPEQKRKRPEVFCSAPILERRRIKSSNGAIEERILIETTFAMGGQAWPIALSLTNRDQMGFRLLIGRDALARRVLIHPGRKHLLGH